MTLTARPPARSALAAAAAFVTLEEADGTTTIHYRYEAGIGGKVASVGGRLLDGAARFIIGQFFAALAAQAGGPRPGARLVRAHARNLRGRAMKPAPFDYVRAETLEEALDVLARRAAMRVCLPAGRSLLPMLNMRLARPQVVIDVMSVAALQKIEERGGSAASCMRACGRSKWRRRANLPSSSRCLPPRWLLSVTCRPAAAARSAVRSRMPIPPPRLPLVLIALGGTVHLRSRRASRKVARGKLLHRHDGDRPPR